MAMKPQLTKRRRGAGRPLKEESNAIQLEKNLLEFKTKMIAMIPDAHKVLRDLMMSTNTKDNIRENIAKYVIEKGEVMMSDYFDEDNEDAENGNNVDDGSGKKAAEENSSPFTTEIIPMAK